MPAPAGADKVATTIGMMVCLGCGQQISTGLCSSTCRFDSVFDRDPRFTAVATYRLVSVKFPPPKSEGR